MVMVYNFPKKKYILILFVFNLDATGFSSAVATLYGDPTGAGSGGACGLEDDVAKAPYNAMITAGNQVYSNMLLCNQNEECSQNPITVTLTDECPGTCNDDPIHFDLSGNAFGAMVACDHKQNIMFKVEKGSNPRFIAIAIEAQNGDGDLSLVEIKHTNSNEWLQMQQMLTSQNKHEVQADNVIPINWQAREIYYSNDLRNFRDYKVIFWTSFLYQ
ncbi:hypothetical protein H5410_028930 [Solanum commersonii]|uniref:Expansin-like EG45 domain-containing protein n=1 Tax=Solanum commersonii TaxID=4109 RepID=A0A9J5Z915_SOLCO|nr:hypothetical protein H5410_028930 [Solanum commersonii]